MIIPSDIRTGPLFLKLINESKKFVVCQGGGDAGKTVTILQVLACKATQKRNLTITVASITVDAARAGALKSFQKYVLPWFQQYIVKFNETSRTYTFWNGSIIEFKSYEDELKAQGSERDYLFINECNHYDYETFWQLQRKTRIQVFLDYNPTSTFWVHEKLLPLDEQGLENLAQEKAFKGRVKRWIVDHRHNPFLSAEDHEAYENISDPDLFRVYSRGFTGKIKGLIFGHFKKIFDPFPLEAQRFFWGIDYGYTNDPTAIMKCAATGRKRTWKEFGDYKPGIAAETIKNILIYHGGWQEGQAIYSEADPNMINQLRILGMPVEPAIKGPNSIAAGISKTKEHECFYTADSLNFEVEIGRWKWVTAKDIVTGKEIMTNVPIDAWNHCCDAVRMGDYTDSFRNRAA